MADSEVVEAELVLAPTATTMARPVDPVSAAEMAAQRQYHDQLYAECVRELESGLEQVRQLQPAGSSSHTLKNTRAVLVRGRKVRAEYVTWNWDRAKPNDGSGPRPTPAALPELESILEQYLGAHLELGGWDPADDLSCCCCPCACTTGPCRVVYDPSTTCCAVH